MRRTVLDALLLQLRVLLRGEAPLRLHRQTPVDREGSFGHEIGMPFTVAFSRYIGHPDGWGTTRSAMSSILEVSEWCHGKHTSHQLPGNSRSLCAQLVYETAYLGQDIVEVARVYDLPMTQAEGMLLRALQHALEWRGRKPRLVVDYDAPDPLATTA